MRGFISPLLISIALTLSYTNSYSETLIKREIVGKVRRVLDNSNFVLENNNCKFIVRNKGKLEVNPGDRVLIKGFVIPLKEYKNPGLFDFDRYNRMKGICGYISPENITKTETTQLTTLYQIRRNLYKSVDNLPYPTDVLIKAFVFGIRDDIKEKLVIFRNLGLIHIFAISGLHFAIFVGTIYLILRYILRLVYLIKPTPIPITPDRIAYIPSLLFIPLLLILTGYPPSAIRTSAMYIAYTPKFLLERNVSLLKALLIGIILVMILEPSNLYEVGFILSVNAVLAIIIANKILEGKNKTAKFLLFPLIISVVITPTISFLFGKIYLLSPIANLFVPVFSFLISLNFAYFIFNQITPQFITNTINGINIMVLDLTTYIGDSKFVKNTVINSTKVTTILTLIPLIVTLSFLVKDKRYRYMILSFIIPIIIYAYLCHKDSLKDRAIIFDFGESTVSLVKSDGRNLLFLGGLKRIDLVDRIVRAILYQNVGRIDEIYEIGNTNDRRVIESIMESLVKDGRGLKRDLESDNCYYHTEFMDFTCNLNRCESLICEDPWGNVRIGDETFRIEKTGAIVVEVEDEKGIKWYKAYR